jgi:hypothetical protein
MPLLEKLPYKAYTAFQPYGYLAKPPLAAWSKTLLSQALEKPQVQTVIGVFFARNSV